MFIVRWTGWGINSLISSDILISIGPWHWAFFPQIGLRLDKNAWPVGPKTSFKMLTARYENVRTAPPAAKHVPCVILVFLMLPVLESLRRFCLFRNGDRIRVPIYYFFEYVLFFWISCGITDSDSYFPLGLEKCCSDLPEIIPIARKLHLPITVMPPHNNSSISIHCRTSCDEWAMLHKYLARCDEPQWQKYTSCLSFCPQHFCISSFPPCLVSCFCVLIILAFLPACSTCLDISISRTPAFSVFLHFIFLCPIWRPIYPLPHPRCLCFCQSLHLSGCGPSCLLPAYLSTGFEQLFKREIQELLKPFDAKFWKFYGRPEQQKLLETFWNCLFLPVCVY